MHIGHKDIPYNNVLGNENLGVVGFGLAGSCCSEDGRALICLWEVLCDYLSTIWVFSSLFLLSCLSWPMCFLTSTFLLLSPSHWEVSENCRCSAQPTTDSTTAALYFIQQYFASFIASWALADTPEVKRVSVWGWKEYLKIVRKNSLWGSSESWRKPELCLTIKKKGGVWKSCHLKLGENRGWGNVSTRNIEYFVFLKGNCMKKICLHKLFSKSEIY